MTYFMQSTGFEANVSRISTFARIRWRRLYHKFMNRLTSAIGYGGSIWESNIGYRGPWTNRDRVGWGSALTTWKRCCCSQWCSRSSWPSMCHRRAIQTSECNWRKWIRQYCSRRRNRYSLPSSSNTFGYWWEKTRIMWTNQCRRHNYCTWSR